MASSSSSTSTPPTTAAVSEEGRGDDDDGGDLTNSNKDCSVLITGGSGYLGFRIGQEMAKEFGRVILFDNREPSKEFELLSNVEFYPGDICNKSSLEDCFSDYGDISAVVHAASFGISANENLPAFDEITEKVNLEGSRNVLAAVIKHRVKAMIFTSSVNVVYGGQPIHGLTEEELPYLNLEQFTDRYSQTKMIAEEFILAADRKSYAGRGGQLRTCALRPNGIYGPGEQRHLPRTIEAFRSGMFVDRIGYSKGTLQDMTHVDNAVQAHVKALLALLNGQADSVGGQAYFVTDGQPVNNVDFFADNIVPAITGETRGRIEVPFAIVLFMSRFMRLLSTVFGKSFRLPKWGITPTEAYKTGVTHYFSIEKARRDFGYDPRSGASEESWNEILNSYGLNNNKASTTSTKGENNKKGAWQ